MKKRVITISREFGSGGRIKTRGELLITSSIRIEHGEI